MPACFLASHAPSLAPILTEPAGAPPLLAASTPWTWNTRLQDQDLWWQPAWRTAATRANGSGVLRFFLVAGAFRRAVGRTSPSLHAVRKLDRNCSSVGCSIANATSGASAISTRRLCPARMSLSKRTGSRVSHWALTCRFISSVALASAISRGTASPVDDSSFEPSRLPATSPPA
jgi:hypothetical protein